MRQLQVVAANGFNLYGAMVAREIELARANRGTPHRSGPKRKERAKWKHNSYPGWVNIAKGFGGVVLIEVRSRLADAEWQLLQSVLGFLDRNFSDNIQAINIQYSSDGTGE